MALPENGTEWPPKDANTVFADMAEFAAWWAGTPERIVAPDDTDKQKRKGWLGKWLDSFWGRVSTNEQVSRRNLHVPVASDIAQTSANLLYANAPAITSDNEETANRLAEYLEDGLIDTLLAGAETGAALGGRYHRVTFDPMRDMPFLTTVDADAAIPEFHWGRLVAVTFWTIVEDKHGTITRHVERHELNANGIGLVAHGLYVGTSSNLGNAMPLTDHSSTAPLATMVDENGYLIEGRTPGLNVAYFPNLKPQRRWRNNTFGRELGRSDYDGGIIGLMDALDETYTSWMRDIRVGQAKLLISEDMLDDKDGQLAFDHSREVFAPLKGVLPGRDTNGMPIEQVQFLLRVEEHARTCEELTKVIVRQCGYSAATFGEHTADTDITATEVKAREKRSHTTRGRKIRLEQPNLEALLRKMLEVDAEVYGTAGLDPDSLAVTFPPAVSETTNELVQTAAMMANARLATTKTLVQMVHPDWDSKQVDAEVEAIKAESTVIDNVDTWRPPVPDADESEEGE